MRHPLRGWSSPPVVVVAVTLTFSFCGVHTQGYDNMKYVRLAVYLWDSTHRLHTSKHQE